MMAGLGPEGAEGEALFARGNELDRPIEASRGECNEWSVRAEFTARAKGSADKGREKVKGERKRTFDGAMPNCLARPYWKPRTV